MKTTISSIKRLNNTPDGNPRWELITEAGSFKTKPDAPIGHVINPWKHVGIPVELTVDGGVVTDLAAPEVSL